MADLTVEEGKMFAKFYGDTDLVNNEMFWLNCLMAYTDKAVALPLIDCAESRRRLHETLDCPSGKCGLCCRYRRVLLGAEDIKRLGEAVDISTVDIKEEGEAKYLDCTDGCQFLKDNECTVYSKRPNACYEFPIQQPREATLDGKQPFQQVTYRLKCLPSLNVIREMMREAVAAGSLLLLPDLSLVNKEEA